MSDRVRRIAENEQRFRVFNDGVRAAGDELQADLHCACECGDAECTEPVQLTGEEYRHVRADARWFMVLPGHERPDVERVVERRDGYLVVEKLGEGADIVS